MRPCSFCTAVVENHDEICPECGGDLTKNQPRTTAVKSPSREAEEAEEIWYREHYLGSLLVTGIVTAVCVANWGWLGIPAGLGISAVLYCVFLGLMTI